MVVTENENNNNNNTNRHATWLELFYDLVFVVVNSQLAHNFYWYDILIPILLIPLSPFLIVCILAVICIAQIIIDVKQHPYRRQLLK
jgi:low temperature requirement protein LtrA